MGQSPQSTGLELMCPPWVLISSEEQRVWGLRGSQISIYYSKALILHPHALQKWGTKPLACLLLLYPKPESKRWPKLELRLRTLRRAARAHICSIWGAQSEWTDGHQRRRGEKNRGSSLVRCEPGTSDWGEDLIGCNLVRVIQESDERAAR